MPAVVAAAASASAIAVATTAARCASRIASSRSHQSGVTLSRFTRSSRRPTAFFPRLIPAQTSPPAFVPRRSFSTLLPSAFARSSARSAHVASTDSTGFSPRAMAGEGDNSGGAAKAKKVLVPIATGTEEMESVIVVDVLRRAGAEVVVASVEPQKAIVASRGVKLVADDVITSVVDTDFDLVVLPGGMPGAEYLRDSTPLKQIVERHMLLPHSSVAAICAAPVVALQSWGVLTATTKATAHPAFSDKLTGVDPAVTASRVVEDGNVVTSRGPGTAIEFALALATRLFGEAKAAEVAAGIVAAKGDGSDLLRVVENKDKIPKPKKEGEEVTVLVAVADGTEDVEAVVPIDVLVRAGAKVTVASVTDSLDLKLRCGTNLTADTTLTDVAAAGRKFDLVFVPGGIPGVNYLRDSTLLDGILREQVAEGRLCAAICAAPVVVLQSKGLIQGKKATAHPSLSDQLADQSAVLARVVVDGPMVTSRGAGTAFEFALTLVEYLFGEDKVVAVAKPMVMSPTLVPVPVPA
ncbi:unnamed protein product [Closterium sp. NIES-64]|nr:unnamed protein product [Closterium sp. NIES-64]